MNYKKIFENAFSDLTPLTDNEKITKNIRERVSCVKEKKKIKCKKQLVAIAAAVVAMTTLTIGVGAANDWNYAAVFQQIFGEKAENIEGNILDESTVIENTFDDFDFKLSAVLADSRSVVAIVDVTSLGGEDLTVLNLFDYIMMRLDYDETNEVSSGSTSSIAILEINENTARLMFRFSTNIDLSGTTARLNIRNLHDDSQRWISEFEIVKKSKEIEYKSDETFFNGTDYINCERFVVTPISVCMDYNVKEADGGLYTVYGGLEVAIISDGKKIAVDGLSSMVRERTEYDYKGVYIFKLKEPVNPEKVTAIVIGETEIKIK